MRQCQVDHQGERFGVGCAGAIVISHLHPKGAHLLPAQAGIGPHALADLHPGTRVQAGDRDHTAGFAGQEAITFEGNHDVRGAAAAAVAQRQLEGEFLAGGDVGNAGIVGFDHHDRARIGGRRRRGDDRGGGQQGGRQRAGAVGEAHLRHIAGHRGGSRDGHVDHEGKSAVAGDRVTRRGDGGRPAADGRNRGAEGEIRAVIGDFHREVISHHGASKPGLGIAGRRHRSGRKTGGGDHTGKRDDQ